VFHGRISAVKRNHVRIDHAVARDIAGAAWTDVEAALLAAADELHRTQDVSDAAWGALAAGFDDAQLVEILYVVGQYTMLSMVANAAGIPSESGQA